MRDLGAMERFYRDVVGLAPAEETRHPDWVEFGAGEVRFSLHRIPQHTVPELPPLSGEPRESGSTKLSFAVANVATEVTRLRALGVRVIERPWGGFDFVDPEGNVAGLDGPPGVASSVETVAPLMAPVPESLAWQPEREPESEPAPAKRGRFNIRIPALLVMLLFGWLMAAIAGLVPLVTFIFPARGFVAGPIMLAGLLAMAIGGLRVRSRTGPASGGLLRDPLYLGMILVLAGWAVFLCNPLTLLGILGFFLAMSRHRA